MDMTNPIDRPESLENVLYLDPQFTTPVLRDLCARAAAAAMRDDKAQNAYERELLRLDNVSRGNADEIAASREGASRGMYPAGRSDLIHRLRELIAHNNPEIDCDNIRGTPDEQAALGPMSKIKRQGGDPICASLRLDVVRMRRNLAKIGMGVDNSLMASLSASTDADARQTQNDRARIMQNWSEHIDAAIDTLACKGDPFVDIPLTATVVPEATGDDPDSDFELHLRVDRYGSVSVEKKGFDPDALGLATVLNAESVDRVDDKHVRSATRYVSQTLGLVAASAGEGEKRQVLERLHAKMQQANQVAQPLVRQIRSMSRELGHETLSAHKGIESLDTDRITPKTTQECREGQVAPGSGQKRVPGKTRQAVFA